MPETLPQRSYLLCTMPRSGSTMMCDLLGQAGNAGRPNSFFREKSMAAFAQDWAAPSCNLGNFDQTYLTAARAFGTGDTGCFGLRSMWDNMPALIARLGVLYPQAKGDLGCLHAAFGPMRFVHLSRADKVAEAVSLAMASQTGLWHLNTDGTERERTGPPADPVYDANQIAAEYDEVTKGDAAWRAWFTVNDITPFSLSYEALAADPSGQLAMVLDFIGVDPSPANGLTPGTARLATAQSRAWADRFRVEAGIASPSNPA